MKPSFDTWTIVFLIAAVQSLFVALVLAIRQSGHHAANRALAALLCLFALSLTEYVLYWTRYIGWFPHIADISTHFPFLFGPLLWYYLHTIYENRPFSKRDLWHGLPFLLATILFLPWYLEGSETKRAILENSNKLAFPVAPQVVRWLVLARILHLLLYVAMMVQYIKRQPVVGLTAQWARWLVAFYTGFVLAYTSYFILVRMPWFNLAWDYHISAAMTAFIYLVAYAGYTQPAIFNGFTLQEATLPAKYQHSGLTPEAGRSLVRKLEAVMMQEKLYRDPTLNLDTLAAHIGAGKHHVSQVINTYLEATFFEYINQLRIEEAKDMLAGTNRSDLHIIEAAYAVGFNNKVSFNAAFKKATGMTPTQYRKSHGRSDAASGQPGGAQ